MGLALNSEDLAVIYHNYGITFFHQQGRVSRAMTSASQQHYPIHNDGRGDSPGGAEAEREAGGAVEAARSRGERAPSYPRPGAAARSHQAPRCQSVRAENGWRGRMPTSAAARCCVNGGAVQEVESSTRRSPSALPSNPRRSFFSRSRLPPVGCGAAAPRPPRGCIQPSR